MSKRTRDEVTVTEKTLNHLGGQKCWNVIGYYRAIWLHIGEDNCERGRYSLQVYDEDGSLMGWADRRTLATAMRTAKRIARSNWCPRDFRWEPEYGTIWD